MNKLNFGYLGSSRRSFLLWTFKHPLFALHSEVISIDDIMSSTRIGENCDDCEFFHRLQSARLRMPDSDLKSQFGGALAENHSTSRCNHCDGTIKSFILEHPSCIGFDGELEMNEALALEDAGKEFNVRMSSFLHSELRNIRLVGALIKPSPKIEKLGDFDILGYLKNNGDECVFSIESKFGDLRNTKESEYIKFIDKHYWLSKSLEGFGSTKVVSIWLSPYENPSFPGCLIKALTNNEETRREYDEIIFLNKSIREKTILSCFGNFNTPADLENHFTSPDWQQFIDDHLQNLSEILSGII